MFRGPRFSVEARGDRSGVLPPERAVRSEEVSHASRREAVRSRPPTLARGRRVGRRPRLRAGRPVAAHAAAVARLRQVVRRMERAVQPVGDRVGARWRDRPERYGGARPLPPGPTPGPGRSSSTSRSVRARPSWGRLSRLRRDLRRSAVPDDDPADPFLDVVFETTDIQVVLDGRVLMAGTGTELVRFRYGPVYFDEPIVFPEPVPVGDDLNATSALFVAGIGAVYRPLPVGQHTLVYTVHSMFFGDRLRTYHITVSPR